MNCNHSSPGYDGHKFIFLSNTLAVQAYYPITWTWNRCMDFVPFDFGEKRAVFKGSNRKRLWFKLAEISQWKESQLRRYNRETSEGFELVRFFFLFYVCVTVRSRLAVNIIPPSTLDSLALLSNDLIVNVSQFCICAAWSARYRKSIYGVISSSVTQYHAIFPTKTIRIGQTWGVQWE